MISRRALTILPPWRGARPATRTTGSPFYSSGPSNQDGDSPAQNNEPNSVTPEKSEQTVRKPSSRSKLMTVLAGMRVENSSNAFKKATPQPEKPLPRREEQKSNLSDQQPRKGDTENVAKVESELVDAVDEIAAAFSEKIDPKQTKTELMGILEKHAENTAQARKRAPKDLSHLLAGMKIDRTKKTQEESGPLNDRMNQAFEVAQRPIRTTMESFFDQGRTSFQQQTNNDRQRRPAPSASPAERIDIFGAEPLGVFTNLAQLSSNKPKIVLKTWAWLEEEELKKVQRHPAKNAFEETSRWTKEGKLWRFPINNEQDFDEEKNVDFSEHIFLEHLIFDFPQKGPIKQFMGVVIFGLSKNAFLSLEEKREHVDWFRGYFKEKKTLLEEVLGEEFCRFREVNFQEKEEKVMTVNAS